MLVAAAPADRFRRVLGPGRFSASAVPATRVACSVAGSSSLRIPPAWLRIRLRLWLRCGLLARLNSRRRLPRHRSSGVFFVLQAETGLIPAILCRHGSIAGGRQWRRRMGVLVRLEYRILRRLVRTLRFAGLTYKAFVLGWCREPRRASTRRAIPPEAGRRSACGPPAQNSRIQ